MDPYPCYARWSSKVLGFRMRDSVPLLSQGFAIPKIFIPWPLVGGVHSVVYWAREDSRPRDYRWLLAASPLGMAGGSPGSKW